MADCLTNVNVIGYPRGVKFKKNNLDYDSNTFKLLCERSGNYKSKETELHVPVKRTTTKLTGCQVSLTCVNVLKTIHYEDDNHNSVVVNPGVYIIAFPECDHNHDLTSSPQVELATYSHHDVESFWDHAIKLFRTNQYNRRELMESLMAMSSTNSSIIALNEITEHSLYIRIIRLTGYDRVMSEDTQAFIREIRSDPKNYFKCETSEGNGNGYVTTAVFAYSWEISMARGWHDVHGYDDSHDVTKYGYKVGTFTGVDAHDKTFMLGHVLQLYSTVRSFKFVWTCYYEICGNRFAKILMTDQDPHMAQGFRECCRALKSDKNACDAGSSGSVDSSHPSLPSNVEILIQEFIAQPSILTIKELKQILVAYGVQVSGAKDVLIDRVNHAIQGYTLPAYEDFETSTSINGQTTRHLFCEWHVIDRNGPKHLRRHLKSEDVDEVINMLWRFCKIDCIRSVGDRADQQWTVIVGKINDAINSNIMNRITITNTRKDANMNLCRCNVCTKNYQVYCASVSAVVCTDVPLPATTTSLRDPHPVSADPLHCRIPWVNTLRSIWPRFVHRYILIEELPTVGWHSSQRNESINSILATRTTHATTLVDLGNELLKLSNHQKKLHMQNEKSALNKLTTHLVLLPDVMRLESQLYRPVYLRIERQALLSQKYDVAVIESGDEFEVTLDPFHRKTTDDLWTSMPRRVRTQCMSNGKYKISCTCGYSGRWLVPCRHWLAVVYARSEMRHMRSYISSLVGDKWKNVLESENSVSVHHNNSPEVGEVCCNAPVRNKDKSRKARQGY